jgi:uncharacterized protein YozE (UPF0346 family)
MLEAAAREARAAQAAGRGAFYRWLEHQGDRGDPIADFAVDALRDKTFPVAVKSRDELLAYLTRRGADDVAIEAAEEAWEEFTTQGGLPS